MASSRMSTRYSASTPTNIRFPIPKKYSKELVLHDSGKTNRILVLGDRKLVLELNKDTIYGDGTYDLKVTTINIHLLTWHAKIGNTYPPCMYVLLAKKNRKIYDRMFAIMKKLVPDLKPKNVLVDFDRDFMDAASSAFPEAKLKGDYFHLNQFLLKKVINAGLKDAFDSKIDVAHILKNLTALTFIPVKEVKDTFQRVTNDIPKDVKHNEVLNHFFVSFIGSARGDPDFDLQAWNNYEVALKESSTINCCEEYHNAINALFPRKIKSMWFLFDQLQRNCHRHKVTLGKIQRGNRNTEQQKYEVFHGKLSTIVKQYEEYDKMNYLTTIANLK